MSSTPSIKIAIMGGSFDPFHLAHLNSILTVKEIFKLDKILLIPSFKTPLKKSQTSPFHRLAMLKQVVPAYPFMQVDNQEILRKGTSYTYKSINELFKTRKNQELFFIMGLDQFYTFDLWKNFESILQKTHLIVTSRPDMQFPKKRSEFPTGLKPYIQQSFGYKKLQSTSSGLKTKTQSFEKIKLKPNKKFSKAEVFKNIYFLPLKDMDISSSYIKQRLKEDKEFSYLLPKAVHGYIKKNKLYTEQELAPDHSQSLIEFVIKELKEKQAYDIKSYDLREKSLPFSFGLIAVASNTRQTKALAEHLKKKLKEHFNLQPLSEEGKEESRWIVLDYNDLILHILYDYTRKYYNLEELWHDTLMHSQD